eukprot:CAMPEP_0176078332 /NCGR_PEP_ID=MMETSP0120_2-20121206/39172_1 /TAXON_ID=160619 /ORGANISM="Kryptoperidinium foliaceum, Strain CCMP 1326" /LENGTH=75 /DNA_ID=CAMNT_0017412077 /DNA_START=31 /DNA_END=258 /DNA_ORIENTATION=+
MSAVGVPLMLFFGYLCSNNSPMIEIPASNKPDAGKGCYMAAALYAFTFLYAFTSMNKSASAREADSRKVQLVPVS